MFEFLLSTAEQRPPKESGILLKFIVQLLYEGVFSLELSTQDPVENNQHQTSHHQIRFRTYDELTKTGECHDSEFP